MAAVGATKAKLPVSSLILRGALAGAFLAVATSMAVTAAVQTGFPIVGAIIFPFFPFGLCLVILLGTELITGSFALLPCATADNAADWGQVLVNWGWVFLGNLIGSVGYAILLSISLTMMGSFDPLPVGQKLVKVAEAKTIGYASPWWCRNGHRVRESNFV